MSTLLPLLLLFTVESKHFRQNRNVSGGISPESLRVSGVRLVPT